MVGASAVIFDEHERVLLFRHTYRREYPWGIPGGWLKAGEDPTAAVVREVYEESALRIRVLHPLHIGGCQRERRFDLIFLCELQGGSFHPSDEVSEARFFAIDELPTVLNARQHDEIQQILAQKTRRESSLPDKASAV